MKNVKNVNYRQIDNKTPKICLTKEAEVLPADLAWKKYIWTRKYFKKKPGHGYFIWLKKQPRNPLFTCISIGHQNIKQELQNLLILEKGVKTRIQGICNALKKNLAGIHQAKGKVVLKENCVLQYNHLHSWGEKDLIDADYEFFLEKNSQLDYTYKTLFSPQSLKIKTRFNLLEGSTAKVTLIGDCRQGKTEIEETLILRQKRSSGVVKLRLAGRGSSKIFARSRIIAKAESQGHLDCQGILLDNDSAISFTPKLICQNKKAQLTHEASIGRISEEALTYLRMRGLSEEQAINLIVSGFLIN